MSDRYKMLDDWLCKTLIDHPEVIKESSEAVDVYSKLWEIWLVDCQLSMKRIIGDALSEEASTK